MVYTDPCGCCKGACCHLSAGSYVCTQETAADCATLGGVYKGSGTDCADFDCTSGCCESVTTDDGCVVNQCVRGYNSTTCGTECDPVADAVSDPVPDCSGGGTSSARVTGSGYTMSTGDATYDSDVESLINATGGYLVDLSCTGSGTANFDSGDYSVVVAVGVASVRSASISVYKFGVLSATMTLTPSAESATNTACGWAVYPCSDYNGTVTSYGGDGDGTSAQIDVQGV